MHAPPGAIMSAASFSVAAGTIAKYMSGSGAPQLCRGTGVLDNVIADLLLHLERGDILIDGGNSNCALVGAL